MGCRLRKSMAVQRKHVFLCCISLMWMGFLYTTKDLLSSSIANHDVVVKSVVSHYPEMVSTKNNTEFTESSPGNLAKTTNAAITAIAARVWESYPGKTWRGLQLPVITAEPWGRLGNVMGEYASLYALGKAYNVTVRLNPDMKRYMRKIFPYLSMPPIPGKYVKSDWIPIHGVTLRNYANAEVAAAGLLGPKLFLIKDWPFEIQLFNAFRKEIVKELTFSPNVQEEIRQYIDKELNQVNKTKTAAINFVGVHVRRKDYIDFIKKTYKGHVPGKAYFDRAMKYYRRKYPHVIFMVGSDDMRFVKEQFRDEPDVIFAPGSTREIDMAALASCNHSIISLGSYGFWTGYLTGGEVVYPNITFEIPYQFSREWYNIAKLDLFTPIAAD